MVLFEAVDIFPCMSVLKKNISLIAKYLEQKNPVISLDVWYLVQQLSIADTQIRPPLQEWAVEIKLFYSGLFFIFTGMGRTNMQLPLADSVSICDEPYKQWMKWHSHFPFSQTKP